MDFRVSSADLTIFLVSIVGCYIQYAETACDEVKVRGTLHQHTRAGTYRKYSNCNGRVSYIQKDIDLFANYIFYLDNDNGWNGWMIGTAHCFNRGGIAVQDEAKTPDKVEEPWDEVYGGVWVTSDDLDVKCVSEISVGTIVGIVFGVLIILVLLIVIVVCCCKKNGQKRGAVRQSPQGPGRLPLARGHGRGAPGHRAHNMGLHHQTTTTSSTSTTVYHSAQQPQPYGNAPVFYSAQSGTISSLTPQGVPQAMPYTMQAPPAYNTVYGPPPAYDTLSPHHMAVRGQDQPPTYLTPLDPASAPPPTVTGPSAGQQQVPPAASDTCRSPPPTTGNTSADTNNPI